MFNKQFDNIIKEKIGEFKQAIILRTDLGMGKGKMVAQGAHASLHAFQKTVEKSKEIAYAWEEEGCRKIVLRAASERELMTLFEKAKKTGLPVTYIRDAGATQLEAGTITALGIGPWKSEEIDEVTKHLKLL
jgi:PTH2 family peptidyl-tRNA hydrolase